MGSSVHSHEGFRPAATCLSTHSLQRIGGGAFHSYTPTMLPQQQQQQPQYHNSNQQQQQSQHHNQQHQQQQQLQQLKGSIQSLPDSALCTGSAGQQLLPSSF